MSKPPFPDWLAMKQQAFERFLQRDDGDSVGWGAPERENVGLEAVLQRFSPQQSDDGLLQLEFRGYVLDTPTHTVDDCRLLGMHFSAPLRVTLYFIVFDVDEASGERCVMDVKAQEIYLGELPLMTEQGTFIVDGVDCTLLPQLHAAPGVYLSAKKERVDAATLLPSDGVWLRFHRDAKGIYHASINRNQTLLATTLLVALRGSLELPASLSFLADTQDLMQSRDGIATVNDAIYALAGYLAPKETLSDPVQAQRKIESALLSPLSLWLCPVARAQWATHMDVDTREEDHLTAVDVEDALCFLDAAIARGAAPTDGNDLSNHRVLLPSDVIGRELAAGLRRMLPLMHKRLKSSDPEQMMPYDFINSGPLATRFRKLLADPLQMQPLMHEDPIATMRQHRRIVQLPHPPVMRPHQWLQVQAQHPSHRGVFVTSPALDSAKDALKQPWYGELAPFSGVDAAGRLCAQEASWPPSNAAALMPYGTSATAVPARLSKEPKRSPLQKTPELRAPLPGVERTCTPLHGAEVPDVCSGYEDSLAQQKGHPFHLFAPCDGEVLACEDGFVLFSPEHKEDSSEPPTAAHIVPLMSDALLMDGRMVTQHPIVSVGERVTQGQLIATASGCLEGTIALGTHLHVAFVEPSVLAGLSTDPSGLLREELRHERRLDSQRVHHISCVWRDEDELLAFDDEAMASVVAMPSYLNAFGCVEAGQECQSGDILLHLKFQDHDGRICIRKAPFVVPEGISGTVVGVRWSTPEWSLREACPWRKQQEARLGKQEEVMTQEIRRQMAAPYDNFLRGRTVTRAGQLYDQQGNAREIEAGTILTPDVLATFSFRDKEELCYGRFFDGEYFEQIDRLQCIVSLIQTQLDECYQDSFAKRDALQKPVSLPKQIRGRIDIWLSQELPPAAGDILVTRQGHEVAIRDGALDAEADGQPIDVIFPADALHPSLLVEAPSLSRPTTIQWRSDGGTESLPARCGRAYAMKSVKSE